MAQEIDKIIKSTTPPKSKDVLWDNGKELLINRNGKWEPTSASKVNTVTPDWNAQKGEAGYIENRTHYSDTERQQLPSKVENYEINFGNVGGRDAILNFYFRGGFITQIIERTDLSEHVINIAGATIKIKRKNIADTRFYITTSYSFSDNEYIESVYVTKQLSDIYIPNTVIKTTSQTLSDTEKNQALTNLGIDPVVWKYMCNPCIIEYGKSVPEELIGEYNEDVGDSGGYMLKYPNMGMYKIKYEYEDSKYMIINSESIDAFGISCGDQYIPEFNAIEVFYIDSNKKWSMF